MDPGICYLYEYNNNKKIRNAGFLKLLCPYRSCVLQIHAGGVCSGGKGAVNLYAFSMGRESAVFWQVGTVPCSEYRISARILLPESSFPEGFSVQNTDGFLLRPPEDSYGSFWAASRIEGSIDFASLQPLTTQKEQDNPKAPSDSAEGADSQDNRGATESRTDTAAALLSAQSSDPVPSPRTPVIRRISRKELVLLPRKYWYLANNSFLLHGCHNYKHLILVEEEDRYLLGVPGVYDPREARAAAMFGFPLFTREYVSALNLTEEERSDSTDFGHWCRSIRRQENG